MSEIDKIINNLKAFDLSLTSDEVIINELRKIGNFASNVLTIQVGQFVIRSRCEEIFTPFFFEKDISYINDKTFIPQYNRGSLEGESMFYGCMPTNFTDDETNCQMLSIAEVTKIIGRETQEIIEEYTTMGKWRVIKDFKALAIAHHQDFMSKNPELLNIHNGFLDYVKQFPEKEKDFIALAEFMSYEFAKIVTDEKRFEYKISGAFTKNILNSKLLQGILYPSAKHGKEITGFNIVMPPSTVDNNLKLEKVMVWRNRQKGKKGANIPYLYCDTFSPNGKFIWKEPENYVNSAFYMNSRLLSE